MSFQARGGIPRIMRETVTTTGALYRFPALSTHVQLRATTNPVRVYATAKDFTDDANYWTVAPGTAEMLDGPLEDEGLHLRATGGDAAVEILIYIRKG